jgi:Fe-S-cluster-containing dehydrogenase component
MPGAFNSRPASGCGSRSARKNWSGFSYDNTGALGASTWRHVKFGENTPQPGLGGNAPELNAWSFSSDVCKHCENAGCLEACPTGSIVRTEFGGVYIQPDICNGCGYCIVSCPFGVVERRDVDGRAFKCTFSRPPHCFFASSHQTSFFLSLQGLPSGIGR